MKEIQPELHNCYISKGLINLIKSYSIQFCEFVAESIYNLIKNDYNFNDPIDKTSILEKLDSVINNDELLNYLTNITSIINNEYSLCVKIINSIINDLKKSHNLKLIVSIGDVKLSVITRVFMYIFNNDTCCINRFYNFVKKLGFREDLSRLESNTNFILSNPMRNSSDGRILAGFCRSSLGKSMSSIDDIGFQRIIIYGTI
jgi:hypothetical protein